jgi:hypothetical protein
MLILCIDLIYNNVNYEFKSSNMKVHRPILHLSALGKLFVVHYLLSKPVYIHICYIATLTKHSPRQANTLEGFYLWCNKLYNIV